VCVCGTSEDSWGCEIIIVCEYRFYRDVIDDSARLGREALSLDNLFATS